MTTKKYQHWQKNVDEAGIAWLHLDKQGSTVNTINEAVLDELSALLSEDAIAQATGVVIASAKDKGFIAGADIEQFGEWDDEEAITRFIQKGQNVFRQLERLPQPTVALITGFCLGGGLELALACDYRIALDDPQTRLGLPEVKLGIQPGWGGSVRLPRLIGILQAMPLMLSGRTLDARKARRLKLVDAAVPLRQLKRAACYYIEKGPAKRKRSLFQILLNVKPVRRGLSKLFRRKTREKANPEHYPAPFAMIDTWERYGLDKAAFEAETKGIMRLIKNGNTAKNLLHVFHLQDYLKGLAKDSDFKPQHVHVIGAGTMGGDIAAWCALQGMQVTLQDREPSYIEPAIKRAHKLYKKRLKQKHLIQQALDRLIPDPEGHGLARADVIIEAVFENLQVKQDLFKTIEKKAKPNAILATNTSSIPLDEISIVLKKPERLVGIHFFNPVAMMPLVEIIQAKNTDETQIAKALAFVRCIDRLPLPVQSNPGFLVNRVLMPYLMEAMVMLEEGVPAEHIDHIAVNFGMPMGPVELADTIGLDVCLSVADNLKTAFGFKVPERLQKYVKKGDLGRKTQKGFYPYKKGKPVKAKSVGKIEQAHDIENRLIMSMLNESVACLREKIVTAPDALDAGMILGTGFAPFRGGPMHYAKAVGVDVMKERLDVLSERYGKRFEPDKGWDMLS